MRIFKIIVGALLWTLAACLSPTLPLPPPEEPAHISQSLQTGEWEVRGRCTPGALVLVKNVDTGEVVGLEDRNEDGQYLIRIAADACASGEVNELLDDELSDTTGFVFETVIDGEPQGDCLQL